MLCEPTPDKILFTPKMMMSIKRYSELRRFQSFEDRYEYLKLYGSVGASSFGFDRHINQRFYRSREWQDIRREVIIRDNGCDLGVEGYDIHSEILIHHMNPIDVESIVHGDPHILDPEFLITTTHRTHNAIHYGDSRKLSQPYKERRRGDTTLW